jgi:hypothetical protein
MKLGFFKPNIHLPVFDPRLTFRVLVINIIWLTDFLANRTTTTDFETQTFSWWSSVDHIIRYGSKELFIEENYEATKSHQIHNNDAVIGRFALFLSFLVFYSWLTTLIRWSFLFVDWFICELESEETAIDDEEEVYLLEAFKVSIHVTLVALVFMGFGNCTLMNLLILQARFSLFLEKEKVSSG